MPEEKRCPLCGKAVDDVDGMICEECRDYMDKQYNAEVRDKEEILPDDVPVVSDPDVPSPVIDKSENTKPKRGLSKGVAFILVACVFVIVIGTYSTMKIVENRRSLENEEAFWQGCVAENTPVAYAKYLVAFPKGHFVEEAEKNMRELREAEDQEWSKLQRSSDVNDFYAYLNENPQTPYLGRIKFLMDSLSWLSAVKDNTAESYSAYIENVNLGNLSGTHIEAAQKEYNYLSEIKILEGPALDRIKVSVRKLFEALSNNDSKTLLKMFAPELYFYNRDSLYSSTKVVASISKDLSGGGGFPVLYKPQMKSVIAKRDNEGHCFVNLIVMKEAIHETKAKAGKGADAKKVSSPDTLNIEFNKENQVSYIGR
jgi:hypothetical protein